MSKVLVFESDAPFAEQLKSELQAMSHQVTVIDEPSLGLQAAAADRPDLILLSVELPRMSGFSVCGKLKRDTNLKDVPVIIMSTDATEETFEQHRRLRTHAEVYLKKPISFAELSQHIATYLGGDEGNGPSTEVLIDEEVDFVETEIDVESQSSPQLEQQTSAGNGASDAAAFAEQALGSLLDDAHAENTIAAPPPSIPPLGNPGNASAAVEGLQQQIAQLTQRAEQAEARANDAENKLRSAPKNEDLQRLQKDLDDTRAKGGATARDFLELREQINRKDKEMLDLRDQLTGRDKELLGLRDASLTQERATADLNDRMAEVDKQLHDLQRIADAAKADKEQASKRADDYKKKSEKLALELESANQERKADKQRHEEVSALLQAQHASIQAEHHQTLATLQAEQDTRIAAAVEQAKQQLSAELSEAHGKVVADKDAEIARIQTEAVTALGRAEQQQLEEIAKVREEAESLKVAAVAAREAELRQELDNTLTALHRANEAQLEQLRSERKAVEEKFSQELSERKAAEEALSQQLGERKAVEEKLDQELAARKAAEEKLDQELVARKAAEERFEQELAVRKAAEETLSQQLTELRARHDALNASAEATQSSLAQLKESLQGALGKIDEISNRS